jgi:hypothetical protein
MPKRRNKENRGLPEHWQFYHGAYYYRVPPGLEALWDGRKRFPLGKRLPEAYRVYAERTGAADRANNVGQLFDRYALEVVPAKAPQSQSENLRAIKRLRAIFGHLPLTHSKWAQLVYQYVDKRRKKVRLPDGSEREERALTAAHRETEVLSHAFTKAVQWGYIARHPFKDEVRLDGDLALKPRDRLIEDWEIVECLALASRRKKGSVLAIQAYMRLKLLTGLARSDLLRLQPGRDFRADGIHVQRHKTKNTSGKRTIYEWTEELRAAAAMAKAARPVDLAPFLFCDRKGKGYIDEETGLAHGWDSMWSRFMDRVMRETKVTERFTEHDLRAKCASSAETLEHARKLLQHADSRTTQRFYRRAPERVLPLKTAF